MSRIKELHINPATFSRMRRLRFLEIHQRNKLESGEKKFEVPEGLQFLPNSLRYLCWEEYPLKSLPSNIAENLSELHMPHCKVERLWDGVQV